MVERSSRMLRIDQVWRNGTPAGRGDTGLLVADALRACCGARGCSGGERAVSGVVRFASLQVLDCASRCFDPLERRVRQLQLAEFRDRGRYPLALYRCLHRVEDRAALHPRVATEPSEPSEVGAVRHLDSPRARVRPAALAPTYDACRGTGARFQLVV